MRKTILIGLLLMGGCKPSSSTVETVKVVTLSYSPSKTSTGFGPALGGKGGVVITTSTTPEEYDVIVDCPKHGRVVIASRKLFNQATPGGSLEVRYNDYWFGFRHEAK